jgi:hypothetical protein
MRHQLQAIWTLTALLGIALPAAAAPPVGNQPSQAQTTAPEGISSQHWQQMQAYMSAMRSQMLRFHQTTDPAERDRLLREHLKSMQSMMGLMQSMSGGTMGQSMGQMMGGQMHGHMGGAQAGGSRIGGAMTGMQNRMDMMQMLMQQMMEQMQGQMSRSGGSR